MVETWYLQRSQKPSCSWYGRPCRTSLSSSWRSPPWSRWASHSTILPERRAEESVSGAALEALITIKSNVAIRFTVLRGIYKYTCTHAHTTHTYTLTHPPFIYIHYCWGQQKGCNCTGLLTSLPLTLLALTDTLTPSSIHTHFLIGVAGHRRLVTYCERSSDSWSTGANVCACVCVVCVYVCAHIINTLSMSIKSTGKVNKVLSRVITLGSRCPYISTVSCETGNEDRDHNEVLSQQHQSCSPHYHSNGIWLPCQRDQSSF